MFSAYPQKATLFFLFGALSAWSMALPPWAAEKGEEAFLRDDLPILVWQKASDWLEVKDFGAKGDGQTDDTAALQKAFDQLDDGMTLYFPAGIYIVKNTLVIRKSDANGNARRIHAIGLYGCGQKTIIRWEGPEGGILLRETGLLHHNIKGLVFDGNRRASAAYVHDNQRLFETHIYHEFLAFRNFRDYGVFFVRNDQDGASTAEIAFVHTIFANCGTGISFTSFNDYNYTFAGCIFLNNARTGVECDHGNFYIRNCRFVGNAADVIANPEHGSSIRRSVSINAGVFLSSCNPVAPITVEGCLVANWKGSAALIHNGAPLTLFDNVFKHQNAGALPLQTHPDQPILLAANTLRGPEKLTAVELKRAMAVALSPTVSPLHEDSSFMPAQVALPVKYFDVKQGFGAKGDGIADDTPALQKAIAAAKAHGKDAAVYLPKGRYCVTSTLRLEGADYRLQGCGLLSEIIFIGDPNADALEVLPSGRLIIEDLAIKRPAVKIQNNKIEWQGKGVDIRQRASQGGSEVAYRGVYVFGKYAYASFILGLCLDGLAAHDTVLISNTEGNIRAVDSGAAAILVALGYEGGITHMGRGSGGIFGIMTRLSTHSEYGLYIADNQSLIASDLYIEQARAKAVNIIGSPAAKPGRITICLPKLHLNEANVDWFSISNYAGEINVLATQFYPADGPVRIAMRGQLAVLNILGSFFYVKNLEMVPPDLACRVAATGACRELPAEVLSGSRLCQDAAIAQNALRDLRRLGALDWRLHYPSIAKAKRKEE